MDDQETEQAREAMRRIPLFRYHRGPVTRLGGLTNLVFRAGDYCLRIPGKGTEEYINRAHEQQAACEAARACVSPEVLHFDAGSGVMVTRFLGGTVTMSPETFRARQGSPARAALALRKLHDSTAVFPFRFELFGMIDGYLKLLAGKQVDFPPGYHDVLKEAEVVRRALSVRPLPIAACHCDPLCENFLDTGERMWIVDWEYAGTNDPLWDLGDLSVEAGFDADQDRAMMEAYFGGEPRAAEMGRITIYKAMCDLLWTLWGLIQFANQNPADNFWAYASNRFERCKRLMEDAAFANHVAAVYRG